MRDPLASPPWATVPPPPSFLAPPPPLSHLHSHSPIRPPCFHFPPCLPSSLPSLHAPPRLPLPTTIPLPPLPPPPLCIPSCLPLLPFPFPLPAIFYPLSLQFPFFFRSPLPPFMIFPTSFPAPYLLPTSPSPPPPLSSLAGLTSSLCPSVSSPLPKSVSLDRLHVLRRHFAPTLALIVGGLLPRELRF